MTACILTRETEKGGTMINDARVKNQLPPLEIVFAEMVLTEVIEGGEDQFSNKVSSTFIRKYISEN
jgi:phosphopantetheine adenylyltransferase